MLRKVIFLVCLFVFIGLLFLTGWVGMYLGASDEYLPGGEVELGKTAVKDYGCGACHSIPGIPGAVGFVGPPLTKWAERVYIAGTLPNEPDNLMDWLMNPQQIRHGTAMPDLNVTEQDARNISAYLYTLR
jgi:cytochrome c2